MPQHASNHAWHASHALEENKSRKPLLLGHFEFGVVFLARLGMSVPGHQVHTPSEHSNCPERHPVGPVLGFSVGDLNGAHLVFGVTTNC